MSELTSVKVKKDDLTKLRRLKGWYEFNTGERLSHSKLIGRLCDEKLQEIKEERE